MRPSGVVGARSSRELTAVAPAGGVLRAQSEPGVPLVGARLSHGCWTSHRPNRRLLRRYYGYPQLADTKLATSTRQPLLPMFAHWSLASRHMRSWLRIPGRGWLDAASCWATDYPTAPGLQAVRAGLTIVFAVGSAAFASWVSQLPQVQQMVRAGVINVVNGFGVEAGKPLASSPRVKKVACTGGHHPRVSDHAVRLAEHHSGHARAGRQEPEHLLLRRAGRERRLRRQVAGGFSTFALNQGEVCTCPSRARSSGQSTDEFLEAATIRTKAVRQGDPLDSETMIGAQASTDQLEKISLRHRHRHRQGRGRAGRAGRRAGRPRRPPVRRLLRAAHHLRRRQPEAGLPGGDLRSGGVGDAVRR